MSVLVDHDPHHIRQGIIETSAAAKMAQAVPLVPLLDDLKRRGFLLGVATNDAEHPARVQLTAEGIHDYFDFIAGYDSGHGAKPEPGMLLAFCEAVGLEPGEVAMIGDSTHDLHSGRDVGMVRVGVLTGPAKHDDLAPHADVVLPDIGHLPTWLEAR
jgi:phosphoglycolate phosphatase